MVVPQVTEKNKISLTLFDKIPKQNKYLSII